MNKFSIFLFSLCIISIISCNNDDDEIITPELPEVNFYALAVGNTWEYQVEERNFQGEYELLDMTFLLTVQDSSVVNDKTYYNIVSSSEGIDECSICETVVGNMSVRDSLGYLVDVEGQIQFSNENLGQYTFIDEDWALVHGKLNPDLMLFYIENEIISTLENERYGTLSSGEVIPARDKINYAAGIGLVYQTISFVSEDTPKWKVTIKSISR